MTAIAGAWNFQSGYEVTDDCARMLAAQAIYGLDRPRQWSGDGIAMGRRLAQLLPEDAYDRQPLKGEESPYVLVADLRLDNRKELATTLGLSAVRCRTMCDAALLLAAFERWGEECCAYLIGDYAF